MITLEKAREAVRLRYPADYKPWWIVGIGENDAINFRRKDTLENEPGPWERFEPLDTGFAGISHYGFVSDLTSHGRVTIGKLPPLVQYSKYVSDACGNVIVDQSLWDDIVKFMLADAGDADLADSIVARLPKPPVDPDLLAARACVGNIVAEVQGEGENAQRYRDGAEDDRPLMRAFLAGVAHVRQSTDDIVAYRVVAP